MTQPQDTPSPLPWRIYSEADPLVSGYVIRSGNDETVAWDLTAADAALIIRAVNREPAFAAMMEALEPFAWADRAIGDEPGPFRFETASGYRELSRDDIRRAAQAYALAEGKQ